MEMSRQEVSEVLRRAGFPEVADELPRLLPERFDSDLALKVLAPYGIDRNQLIDRMGGSP
jgi:hypothetical protein